MSTEGVFFLSLPATRVKVVQPGKTHISTYSYLYLVLYFKLPLLTFLIPNIVMSKLPTVFFKNAVMANMVINYSGCYF